MPAAITEILDSPPECALKQDLCQRFEVRAPTSRRKHLSTSQNQTRISLNPTTEPSKPP